MCTFPPVLSVLRQQLQQIFRASQNHPLSQISVSTLVILQTGLNNLVYTSAGRLAPVYLMGWIYCFVPNLATKTVCPRFSTVIVEVRCANRKSLFNPTDSGRLDNTIDMMQHEVTSEA